MTLTQHYSAAPICAPARAALMTGRYPQRTGVVDTLAVGGLARLNPAEPTLPEYLRTAGYRTGLFGKWHLGAAFAGCQPHERGFDESLMLDPSLEYWDYTLNRHGHLEKSDGRHLTQRITDEAIDFLRRHRDQPFFCYVPHFAPHANRRGLGNPPDPATGQRWHAPELLVEHYRARGCPDVLAQLYALVDDFDQAVGALLEELDNLGLRDDTLVVITSDNGAQCNMPVEQPETLDRFNWGQRGHKDLVYEGGIHVPAAVRWPAGLPGGQRIHAMNHFTDWLPTLLAAAGVPAPTTPPLDGHDLLPLLRGEDTPVCERRFWQFSRYRPVPTFNAAVREGDWKLVRPPVPAVRRWSIEDLRTAEALGCRPGATTLANCPPPHSGPAELPDPLPPLLFNLAADPGERVDRSAQEPERCQRMLTALEDWFASVEEDRHRIYTDAGLA